MRRIGQALFKQFLKKANLARLVVGTGAEAISMAKKQKFDFVFLDLPDTIPSGATDIRVINDGPDLHHVWLVRLEEGNTLAD